MTSKVTVEAVNGDCEIMILKDGLGGLHPFAGCQEVPSGTKAEIHIWRGSGGRSVFVREKEPAEADAEIAAEAEAEEEGPTPALMKGVELLNRLRNGRPGRRTDNELGESPIG